jgi:hypothetical protein
MAGKKGKAKKAYGKARRFSRRHGSKLRRVPIETLIALGTVPFTGAAEGFGSIYDCVQTGDWTGVIDNLKVGFLGFDPARNAQTFNLGAMLNPFDMQHGRFTKTIIVASLIGAVRRKLTGKYTDQMFRKIPIVGRWVG